MLNGQQKSELNVLNFESWVESMTDFELLKWSIEDCSVILMHQRQNPFSTQFKGWSIKFAGGLYFGLSISNGVYKYSKSNTNVISKIRVGNF